MLRNPAATHIYGPVPSRRLGFSLGVDIVPFKTCSFNCIYCQLGRTRRNSRRRRRFFSSREILHQVHEAVAKSPRIDHITFSGSGEPTLNIAIGDLIRKIKKITDVPVAVLTNSSFLTRKAVRRALRAADVVVPSLDAARAETFRRINRPLAGLQIAEIIRALSAFRREFKGRIWLEVMLVKGINDSLVDIKALKRAIARIRPDKVQLNTVVRPPAEKWARPLPRRALEKIAKQLGGEIEVVADFRKPTHSPSGGDIKRAILDMAERRPVTQKDIASSLGREEKDIRPHLETLLRWRRLNQRKYGRSFYYSSSKKEPRKEKRSTRDSALARKV